MSCPKTKLISAYLDREVESTEKNALESHILGCRSCSQALEEMRSLHTAFAKVEHHSAPFGFSTRVMAHAADMKSPSPYPLPLGERIKVRGWLLPFFVRFAEAAVLLIVITVGIFAGKAMTNGSSATAGANIASSLSLDLFDATPSGSLGSAYIAMIEAKNEK